MNYMDSVNKYKGTIDLVAWILVIVGGINWGLIGLFNLNLIGTIFGFLPFIARLIYILIGVSAGYLIYLKYVKKQVSI